MIKMLSNNKLVMAATALVIAGAIWYGFSGSSASDAVLGTENASGAASPEDQEIVATLLKLRSVTLSGTIFSSPAFLGLKDFSTEIMQEPVGRVDPFAALPYTTQGSASGANNAGSAGLFNKPRP